jgi:hypothetical protein
MLTCAAVSGQFIVVAGGKTCAVSDSAGNNTRTYFSIKLGIGPGAGVAGSGTQEFASVNPDGVPGWSGFVESGVRAGPVGIEASISKYFGSGWQAGAGGAYGLGGTVLNIGVEYTMDAETAMRPICSYVGMCLFGDW